MKILWLMIAGFAVGCSDVSAQASKKTTPSPSVNDSKTQVASSEDQSWLFDRAYVYINDQVKKGRDIMNAEQAEKLMNDLNNQPEVKARKAKLYRQDYSGRKQYKTTSGESDRLMLLQGIPEPKAPSPALQADPRENEKYSEKIKHFRDLAAEEARSIANSTELAKTYHRDGEAAVKKQFEDKADQSELVRDMGGARAVQNMTEEERKEAAKKMVARQTGGHTAEEIEKMTPAQKQALAWQMAASKNASGANADAAAFTQKMMNDPSFRAQYEKMSNARKQEVYTEFLQSRGSTGTFPHETREMKDTKNDAEEILEVNRIAEEFRDEMKKLFAPIDALSMRYDKETALKQQQLTEWVDRETEKLPTVRDSEYGERKDGVERVYLTQAMLSFEIGKDKIAKEREIWNRYLDAYLTAFTTLDEWTAKYEKRNGLSDRLKLQLAQLKIAGYEEILELNRRAGYITGVAGSIQYGYNCVVLRNCYDPRQEKYLNNQ